MKLSFWDMLRKLWSNTFHLESKFLRTFWELFIPARITLNFFNGKQQRYPPPLRVFAIVAFFFLLLANHLFEQQAQKASSNKDGAVKIQISDNGDTIRNRNIRLQSMGQDLFKYGAYVSQKRALQQRVARHPDWQQDSTSRQAVDSLLQWMQPHVDSTIILLLESKDPKTGKSILADTLPLNMGFHSVWLRSEDIFLYEPDTIIERYGFSDWKDKLVVRQGIKSMRDPSAMAHNYIGSITWTLLSIITLMALVLKLLYRRRQRYYMEHFIFLLHYHTSGLLLLGLALLLDNLFQMSWFASITILGLALFLLIAMRRFYKQSWGKTLLKYFIFAPVYFISSVVLFLLGLLVVLIVF